MTFAGTSPLSRPSSVNSLQDPMSITKPFLSTKSTWIRQDWSTLSRKSETGPKHSAIWILTQEFLSQNSHHGSWITNFLKSKDYFNATMRSKGCLTSLGRSNLFGNTNTKSIECKHRISFKITRPLIVQVDPAPGSVEKLALQTRPTLARRINKTVAEPSLSKMTWHKHLQNPQKHLPNLARHGFPHSKDNSIFSDGKKNCVFFRWNSQIHNFTHLFPPVPKRLLSWHTLPRKVPKGVCCGQTRPKARPWPCKAIDPWVQMPWWNIGGDSKLRDSPGMPWSQGTVLKTGDTILNDIVRHPNPDLPSTESLAFYLQS